MTETIEDIRKIDARERTDAQHDIIHEFHVQKLHEFYHSWGVGETDAHKARFWKSYEPNVSVSHFEPGSEQWVRALELGWMSDNFPQDFIHC
jgi:hypothetical protein